jgi:hypothetical protein
MCWIRSTSAGRADSRRDWGDGLSTRIVSDLWTNSQNRRLGSDGASPVHLWRIEVAMTVQEKALRDLVHVIEIEETPE